jgi:hypothetical protein
MSHRYFDMLLKLAFCNECLATITKIPVQGATELLDPRKDLISTLFRRLGL